MRILVCQFRQHQSQTLTKALNTLPTDTADIVVWPAECLRLPVAAEETPLDESNMALQFLCEWCAAKKLYLVLGSVTERVVEDDKQYLNFNKTTKKGELYQRAIRQASRPFRKNVQPVPATETVALQANKYDVSMPIRMSLRRVGRRASALGGANRRVSCFGSQLNVTLGSSVPFAQGFVVAPPPGDEEGVAGLPELPVSDCLSPRSQSSCLNSLPSGLSGLGEGTSVGSSLYEKSIAPSPAKVYETCVVIDPRGRIICKHRRRHPTNETKNRGHQVGIFETKWGSIGIVIGGDLFFPNDVAETVRAAPFSNRLRLLINPAVSPPSCEPSALRKSAHLQKRTWHAELSRIGRVARTYAVRHDIAVLRADQPHPTGGGLSFLVERHRLVAATFTGPHAFFTAVTPPRNFEERVLPALPDRRALREAFARRTALEDQQRILAERRRLKEAERQRRARKNARVRGSTYGKTQKEESEQGEGGKKRRRKKNGEKRDSGKDVWVDGGKTNMDDWIDMQEGASDSDDDEDEDEDDDDSEEADEDEEDKRPQGVEAVGRDSMDPSIINLTEDEGGGKRKKKKGKGQRKDEKNGEAAQVVGIHREAADPFPISSDDSSRPGSADLVVPLEREPERIKRVDIIGGPDQICRYSVWRVQAKPLVDLGAQDQRLHERHDPPQKSLAFSSLLSASPLAPITLKEFVHKGILHLEIRVMDTSGRDALRKLGRIQLGVADSPAGVRQKTPTGGAVALPLPLAPFPLMVPSESSPPVEISALQNDNLIFNHKTATTFKDLGFGIDAHKIQMSRKTDTQRQGQQVFQRRPIDTLSKKPISTTAAALPPGFRCFLMLVKADSRSMKAAVATEVARFEATARTATSYQKSIELREETAEIVNAEEDSRWKSHLARLPPDQRDKSLERMKSLDRYERQGKIRAALAAAFDAEEVERENGRYTPDSDKQGLASEFAVSLAAWRRRAVPDGLDSTVLNRLSSPSHRPGTGMSMSMGSESVGSAQRGQLNSGFSRFNSERPAGSAGTFIAGISSAGRPMKRPGEMWVSDLGFYYLAVQGTQIEMIDSVSKSPLWSCDVSSQVPGSSVSAVATAPPVQYKKLRDFPGGPAAADLATSALYSLAAGDRLLVFLGTSLLSAVRIAKPAVRRAFETGRAVSLVDKSTWHTASRDEDGVLFSKRQNEGQPTQQRRRSSVSSGRRNSVGRLPGSSPGFGGRSPGLRSPVGRQKVLAGGMLKLPKRRFSLASVSEEAEDDELEEESRVRRASRISARLDEESVPLSLAPPDLSPMGERMPTAFLALAEREDHPALEGGRPTESLDSLKEAAVSSDSEGSIASSRENESSDDESSEEEFEDEEDVFAGQLSETGFLSPRTPMSAAAASPKSPGKSPKKGKGVQMAEGTKSSEQSKANTKLNEMVKDIILARNLELLSPGTQPLMRQKLLQSRQDAIASTLMAFPASEASMTSRCIWSGAFFKKSPQEKMEILPFSRKENLDFAWDQSLSALSGELDEGPSLEVSHLVFIDCVYVFIVLNEVTGCVVNLPTQQVVSAFPIGPITELTGGIAAVHVLRMGAMTSGLTDLPVEVVGLMKSGTPHQPRDPELKPIHTKPLILIVTKLGQLRVIPLEDPEVPLLIKLFEADQFRQFRHTLQAQGGVTTTRDVLKNQTRGAFEKVKNTMPKLPIEHSTHFDPIHGVSFVSGHTNFTAFVSHTSGIMRAWSVSLADVPAARFIASYQAPCTTLHITRLAKVPKISRDPTNGEEMRALYSPQSWKIPCEKTQERNEALLPLLSLPVGKSSQDLRNRDRESRSRGEEKGGKVDFQQYTDFKHTDFLRLVSFWVCLRQKAASAFDLSSDAGAYAFRLALAEATGQTGFLAFGSQRTQVSLVAKQALFCVALDAALPLLQTKGPSPKAMRRNSTVFLNAKKFLSGITAGRPVPLKRPRRPSHGPGSLWQPWRRWDLVRAWFKERLCRRRRAATVQRARKLWALVRYAVNIRRRKNASRLAAGAVASGMSPEEVAYLQCVKAAPHLTHRVGNPASQQPGLTGENGEPTILAGNPFDEKDDVASSDPLRSITQTVMKMEDKSNSMVKQHQTLATHASDHPEGAKRGGRGSPGEQEEPQELGKTLAGLDNLADDFDTLGRETHKMYRDSLAIRKQDSEGGHWHAGQHHHHSSSSSCAIKAGGRGSSCDYQSDPSGPSPFHAQVQRTLKSTVPPQPGEAFNTLYLTLRNTDGCPSTSSYFGPFRRPPDMTARSNVQATTRLGTAPGALGKEVRMRTTAPAGLLYKPRLFIREQAAKTSSGPFFLQDGSPDGGRSPPDFSGSFPFQDPHPSDAALAHPESPLHDQSLATLKFQNRGPIIADRADFFEECEEEARWRGSTFCWRYNEGPNSEPLDVYATCERLLCRSPNLALLAKLAADRQASNVALVERMALERGELTWGFLHETVGFAAAETVEGEESPWNFPPPHAGAPTAAGPVSPRVPGVTFNKRMSYVMQEEKADYVATTGLDQRIKTWRHGRRIGLIQDPQDPNKKKGDGPGQSQPPDEQPEDPEALLIAQHFNKTVQRARIRALVGATSANAWRLQATAEKEKKEREAEKADARLMKKAEQEGEESELSIDDVEEALQKAKETVESFERDVMRDEEEREDGGRPGSASLFWQNTRKPAGFVWEPGSFGEAEQQRHRRKADDERMKRKCFMFACTGANGIVALLALQHGLLREVHQFEDAGEVFPFAFDPQTSASCTNGETLLLTAEPGESILIEFEDAGGDVLPYSSLKFPPTLFKGTS